MINLLPDEHKQEIRAGRTNVLLLRYIGISLVAVVVLGGLIAGVYLTLNEAKAVAEAAVAENQSRTSEYQAVKTQSESFRADLATAKGVLDSSVSFSKLIYRIAEIVPPNVILSSLALDPQTFGSSVTMSASARSFDDAAKLRDAFIRSNEVFSNVQLQTIESSGDSSGESGAYPVKVNLSVVINKGALQ